MTPESQIKALAELDGWNSLGQDAEMTEHWIQFPREVISRLSYGEIRKQRVWCLPSYLTSYDAIIPLIQKQPKNILVRIVLGIKKAENDVARMVDWLQLTPSQLCEALLRATGKWED